MQSGTFLFAPETESAWARMLHELLQGAARLFASDDEPRTVKGRRRRPTGSSSDSRERAEGPTRDEREDGGASSPPPPPPPPPQGPSGPPLSSGGSSGGGMPMGGGGGGRMSPLMLLIVGAVVIGLLVCGGPTLLFNSGGGDQAQPPAPLQESAPLQSQTESQSLEDLAASTAGDAAEPAGEAAPAPAAAGDAAASQAVDGQTWTIMLYQDADDKVLEQDIYIDFNEAERIGSTDQVHIVAQVDRYRAGYNGDGNWSSTKRFYLTEDGDLERAGSASADLGEANMADAATLVDFVEWSVENYPADKYVLIMSDHGMGWPGGWSDPDPQTRGERGTPIQEALGNQLYLNELDMALGEIRARTGIDKFELIGMDACLMSHVEVFSALAPHARYAVASQETEPALGWAYTGFLGDLVANPDVTGAELSQHIVESYIDEDQRIVDDQARAAFVSRGSPFGFGVPTAAQLARQFEEGITLTAVDLSLMPTLIDSLNDFSYTLSQTDQKGIAKARNYAQSFTSIFGQQVPPSYIDLAHFAALSAQATGDRNVEASANRLISAVDAAVIAEKHGDKKPGATGISIYFPNSQLYRSPVAGPQSYTAIAERFATESLWDDFMAFHYTGRRFEPAQRSLAVPDRSTTIEAPGAGAITVSPVEISDTSVAPGELTTLSALISGENVGYIYLYAGFLDEEANSVYVADIDYIDSGDTRVVNGVFYPEWGEGDFRLEFDWEPIVFAINDGEETVQARFQPQSYGVSPESAVYTVDGVYTYADGEERVAQLYFSNDELRQVFGFTNEDGTGAPREITPAVGDRFTVLERWLDLDADGNIVNSDVEAGGTLTFRGEPFVWEVLDAPAGEFIVGFIAEDLDGNATQSFTRVNVE